MVDEVYVQSVSLSDTLQFVSLSDTLQYISLSDTLQYISLSGTLQSISLSGTLQYASLSGTFSFAHNCLNYNSINDYESDSRVSKLASSNSKSICMRCLITRLQAMVAGGMADIVIIHVTSGWTCRVATVLLQLYMCRYVHGYGTHRGAITNRSEPVLQD